MNIYTTQLKRSILAKLDRINDAEYLSSLDAILTHEIISPDGRISNEKNISENGNLFSVVLKKIFAKR